MIIETTSPAFGGLSVGRIDGKAVFVPYALPGETLEIELTEEKKTHSFAVITSVVRPAPGRIEPECPAFGRCGGCDYLCADYPTELEMKKEIIVQTAKRIGGITIEPDQIRMLSEARCDWRSRCSVKSDGRSQGFFRRGSNQVVGFPETGCMMLTPEIRTFIKDKKFAEGTHRVVSDGSAAFTADQRESITLHDLGFTFSIMIDSFFQANQRLRKTMVDTVIGFCGEGKSALEIGCGSGFFTIPLSRHFDHVQATEVVSEAIASAKLNAAANGCTNISFVREDMNRPRRLDRNIEMILADPPRGGLSRAMTEAINAGAAERLVYVSCDIPAWARDAALLRKGGYELQSAVFLDMFPGSMHIELVSGFTRNSRPS